MLTQSYAELKRQNETVTALINKAWGERVAWVEDRTFITPAGFPHVLPVITSLLVGGKRPGRRDVPAFFPGPAIGAVK